MTICWSLQSDGVFTLPNGLGRMESEVFDNGVTLYRSQIEVLESTEIDMSGMVSEPFLAVQFIIMGRAQMVLADGTVVDCHTDVAHAMRVDTSSVFCHIDGPQALRHVGVTLPLAEFQRRLKGQLPKLDGALCDASAVVDRMVALPVASSLRSLAVSIWGHDAATPLDRMALEARAVYLYAVIVNTLAEAYKSPSDKGEPWERDAFETVRKIIHNNLRARLDIDALAQSVRMSPSRLEALFRAETGQSFAAYNQALRLAEARRRLVEEDVLVKQIAFDCGYDHVSNFSRAYQRFHGESPRRTRERGVL